jgi:hypothetical protein
MRSLLLVVISFCFTILCWGLYIPVLHWGQHAMSTTGGVARLRPFVCVGLAYFLIGVIVPAVLLQVRGEAGSWTAKGTVFSLLAGALGAAGALGIVMAIFFGGNPFYVAPLVFGLAPVVNAFLTIYLARRVREIGPLFMAGLVIVLLGAVTVLLWAPKRESVPAKGGGAAAAAPAKAAGAGAVRAAGNRASRFVLLLVSVGATALCWGSYGPTLHKGQSAMHNSRLRPLLCVGIAYFAIAVLVPNLMLQVAPEDSTYNFKGTLWCLLGGAAGAGGALGLILAFNFGGKPIFVMPLVYGGAPVVATLVNTAVNGDWDKIRPTFIAGLMLVIAGSAMVLVFAPKGGPAPGAPAPKPTTPTPSPLPGEATTETFRREEAATEDWPKQDG